VTAKLKSYFWKLSVSFLLILSLLPLVNGRELAELALGINPPFLIAYFALNILDRVIMAAKWKILLDSKNIPCSLRNTIVIYFKGTFWGNLFPSSLGGDAIRAYELSKNTKMGVDVVSSIFMERFLGFFSSALMAILSLPFIFLWVPGFPRVLWVLLISFFSIGIVFLVLVLRGEEPHFIRKFRIKFVWAEKVSKITSSVALYRDHPVALGKFFLWSFGEQLVPIFTVYFLALALNLPIPFYYLVLIIPIAQFFARIPVSLSGFGVQEGLYISLFSFLGVSTTAAFALGFASNLGNIIGGFPGAYFYFKGSSGKTPGNEEK
jgi:glycosyltransferase 2 family protein